MQSNFLCIYSLQNFVTVPRQAAAVAGCLAGLCPVKLSQAAHHRLDAPQEAAATCYCALRPLQARRLPPSGSLPALQQPFSVQAQ